MGQLAPNLAVRQMVEDFVRAQGGAGGGGSGAGLPEQQQQQRQPEQRRRGEPAAADGDAVLDRAPVQDLPVQLGGLRAPPLVHGVLQLRVRDPRGEAPAPERQQQPEQRRADAVQPQSSPAQRLPLSFDAPNVYERRAYDGDDEPLLGGTLRVLGVEPNVQRDASGRLSSLLTPCVGYDGKFFRFSAPRLGRLLSASNGYDGSTDEGWASHGTAADAGTHVKGGGGAVLRARNERTGREGGALLFAAGGEAHGVGVGCWNPSDYAAPGDFEAGDVLVLLDYAVEPSCARGEVLAVDSYAKNTGTGWNLPGDAIRFGRCGLVGDSWTALEVGGSPGLLSVAHL